MGKYSSARRPPTPRRVTTVNPVMRGIGCIMMVIVPIFSYISAIFLMNYGTAHGWPIPPSWIGFPTIPPLLLKLSGIKSFIDILKGYPQFTNNLVGNLVFTLVIILIVGGIMSVIFGYIYTIFGPSKYGPTDVPPSRQKVRPYKR